MYVRSRDGWGDGGARSFTLAFLSFPLGVECFRLRVHSAEGEAQPAVDMKASQSATSSVTLSTSLHVLSESSNGSMASGWNCLAAESIVSDRASCRMRMDIRDGFTSWYRAAPQSPHPWWACVAADHPPLAKVDVYIVIDI